MICSKLKSKFYYLQQTKKIQQIDILLIDDNKEFCRSLRNNAASLGSERNWHVVITDFQDLESGFAHLEKESKYKGLILDAKCILRAGESDDFQFLPVALSRLEKILNITGRVYIPFSVCTGYYGYEQVKVFAKQLEEQKGRLFDKTDEDNMLTYLFEAIETLEDTKIEKEYAEIFEIFRKGYLKEETRRELMKVLKNLHNREITEIRLNLGLIRRIKETVIEALRQKNPDFTQPELISQYSSHLIPKIGSSYGVHPPRYNPQKTDITPSYHSVMVLAHALLEILLWFKSEMEK